MSEAPDLDGSYIAVLDRFEGERAVFVVEDENEAVAEFDAPRADVPEEGEHTDAVFRMQFDHGEVMSLTYDADETASREQATQTRFDRLSKRLPREEDGGDDTENN